MPAIVERLRTSLQPVEPGAPDVPERWRALRPAAVLILLFPRGETVRFLLTLRRETLRHHAGQVSLPGGRIDPEDESGWLAALREAREELGLRTGRVRPIGRLAPVPTVVSNHLVIPYLGWSPVAPHLSPNPHEVAEVVEVRLDDLLDPTAIREDVWELRGQPYLVTHYWLEGHVVWGATARVLSELTAALGAPETEYPPGSVRLEQSQIFPHE